MSRHAPPARSNPTARLELLQAHAARQQSDSDKTATRPPKLVRWIERIPTPRVNERRNRAGVLPLFPKVVSASAATHHELRKRRTLEFLETLRSPTRAMIDARQIAVVTAHPDDETIGCGAQLPRLSGITIVTISIACVSLPPHRTTRLQSRLMAGCGTRGPVCLGWFGSAHRRLRAR